MLRFCFFFSLIVFTTSENVDYTGHKVINIQPTTEDDVILLKEIQDKNTEADFWTEAVVTGVPVSMRLPPGLAPAVEALLTEGNITYRAVCDNLQEVIEKERTENKPEGNFTMRGPNFQKDVYHSLDEIYQYMDWLNDVFPELTLPISLEETHEGRPIRGLKISSGGGGIQKKAVWIDAGIHAREWIAPATAIYIMDLLVEGYPHDQRIKAIVDEYDWYIFPVLNPDGYHYSWTTDRMWRKTRANSSSHPFCKGVDANRNFEIHFGGAGTRNNPCHETYPGTKAFSEPESRAVKTGLMRRKGSIKAYFTLHSFSQLWMVPYAYTRTKPQGYNDIDKTLKVAQEAIRKKHGTEYRIGTISSLLYPGTGTSVDWVFDVVGVKYSYAIELRDRGEHGFMLPKSFILPTAEETWEGIYAVMDHLKPQFSS